MVAVTSLPVYGLASATEHGVSASGLDHTFVYAIIARLDVRTDYGGIVIVDVAIRKCCVEDHVTFLVTTFGLILISILDVQLLLLEAVYTARFCDGSVTAVSTVSSIRHDQFVLLALSDIG
ncbi:hypothetical protein Tco_1293752 [Tanacetum coccineum]